MIPRNGPSLSEIMQGKGAIRNDGAPSVILAKILGRAVNLADSIRSHSETLIVTLNALNYGYRSGRVWYSDVSQIMRNS